MGWKRPRREVECAVLEPSSPASVIEAAQLPSSCGSDCSSDGEGASSACLQPMHSGAAAAVTSRLGLVGSADGASRCSLASSSSAGSLDGGGSSSGSLVELAVAGSRGASGDGSAGSRRQRNHGASVRDKAAYFEALIRTNTTTYVQCSLDGSSQQHTLLGGGGGGDDSEMLCGGEAAAGGEGAAEGEEGEVEAAVGGGEGGLPGTSEEGGGQGYSEVHMVLRMQRPRLRRAATPGPPPVHERYGSPDEMAALIEQLTAQLAVSCLLGLGWAAASSSPCTLPLPAPPPVHTPAPHVTLPSPDPHPCPAARVQVSERERAAAAALAARKAQECENVMRVVKELSESRSKTAYTKASLQEKYSDLQVSCASCCVSCCVYPSAPPHPLPSPTHPPTHPPAILPLRSWSATDPPASPPLPTTGLPSLPPPPPSQLEYHRMLRIADLSRTVSKENIAKTSRTQKQLKDVELELHATRRQVGGRVGGWVRRQGWVRGVAWVGGVQVGWRGWVGCGWAGVGGWGAGGLACCGCGICSGGCCAALALASVLVGAVLLWLSSILVRCSWKVGAVSCGCSCFCSCFILFSFVFPVGMEAGWKGAGRGASCGSVRRRCCRATRLPLLPTPPHLYAYPAPAPPPLAPLPRSLPLSETMGGKSPYPYPHT